VGLQGELVLPVLLSNQIAEMVLIVDSLEQLSALRKEKFRTITGRNGMHKFGLLPLGVMSGIDGGLLAGGNFMLYQCLGNYILPNQSQFISQNQISLINYHYSPLTKISFMNSIKMNWMLTITAAKIIGFISFAIRYRLDFKNSEEFPKA
jgi:hypothetical protein